MPILSRDKENATGARLARASKKELVLKIMQARMHECSKKKRKHTLCSKCLYLPKFLCWNLIPQVGGIKEVEKIKP